MFKWLTLLLLLTPYTLSEGKVEYNPILSQIVKNRPDIDRQYAETLSKLIYRLAIEFKVKPAKVAAIFAQESMYRLNAVNRGSKDFGIAQINIKTVKAFGFDKTLLLTDLEYSVKAGILVLADFKRMYGHKEQDYWTRYNSSNRLKRSEYKELVTRYL